MTSLSRSRVFACPALVVALAGCPGAAQPVPAQAVADKPALVAAPEPVKTESEEQPEAKAVEVTTAAAPTVPAVPAASTWIVAGEGGVVEVDLTGATLRTIAAVPARSPRWLPGRARVLFLGEVKQKFSDLRVLDLADGEHRSLALLPDGPPCPHEAYEGGSVPELSLTNEDEFFVDARGEVACVVLADHEADLRSVWRDMAIKVADGKVVARVFGGGEVCGRSDEEGPKECAGRPGRPEVESPYESHAVHSRSPDGKWLLIDVASELGDVLHQQFLLHEVASKQLYPLPRGEGSAWPKPSKLDLGKIGGEGLVPGLDDVGGSEAIEWIGPHHLVVGRTLFIAGERIVELPGDVAR
ncbi:MAG: hypothetical protein JNL82_40935 [Myxococcales bacterium]|nr:hypothetical protein [Myxococcales bacterium]